MGTGERGGFAAVARVMAVCALAVTGSGCGQGSVGTAAPPASPVTDQSGGLFTASVPWTVDVSGAATSERRDAVIQSLGDLGGWGNNNTLQVDFSIPIFFADNNSPIVDVTGTSDYCYGGPDCDNVPAQMPVPENANIEGSPDLSCDASGDTEGQGDCHLLVVDSDAGKLYEIYQGTQADNAIAAQGLFVWDLDKPYPATLRGEQCTSADAAGFPIAALTPTADEVASGTVQHALRFILPNDRMKAGVYVAPATHAGGPESSEPDAPPYGVRFRLKPDFDESGYSEPERVILTALKTYGMLLSDGGEIPLTFADDRTSTAKWADLGIDAQSFSDISVDQFDVVDLGAEVTLTYDCIRNP